jgi:hypothetical protein
VVDQQRGHLVPAAVALFAGQPQRGRRVEVDAVGRGQPVLVARARAGQVSRRVSVGAGERAAEALDGLVAGGEGHVGDAAPLPELPGRALEHDAPAQRHR